MTTRKVHTFENIDEKKETNYITSYSYLILKLSFNYQLNAGNSYDKSVNTWRYLLHLYCIAKMLKCRFSKSRLYLRIHVLYHT